MTTIKKFAKLFDHDTMGQLLVQRDTNDDDRPGVRITFDAGIEELQPSCVFLAAGGADDDTANKAADELFNRFNEAMAADSVKSSFEQIQQMFSNRH